MRFVHLICVLLATAICCNAAAVQGDAKSTNQQAVVDTVNKTTTLAKDSSTPAVPANASVTVANATKNDATRNTTTVASATTVSTNVSDNKDNVTAAKEQSTSTTSSTTSTTVIATAAPTTLSTTIPENCTTTGTTTTTTTTTTVTTPTTSNTSVSLTTAVPVSTKVAPPSPYKERHFDGLSFLGGIILVTCLMAIGVLSWKFYKTFNERNYRTL